MKLDKTAVDDDRLISIKQAAEKCAVDPEFIKLAIRRRELRVYRLGPKTHRIKTSDLVKWFKTKEEKG